MRSFIRTLAAARDQIKTKYMRHCSNSAPWLKCCMRARAKQFRHAARTALLRRFAPRNDEAWRRPAQVWWLAIEAAIAAAASADDIGGSVWLPMMYFGFAAFAVSFAVSWVGAGRRSFRHRDGSRGAAANVPCAADRTGQERHSFSPSQSPRSFATCAATCRARRSWYGPRLSNGRQQDDFFLVLRIGASSPGALSPGAFRDNSFSRCPRIRAYATLACLERGRRSADRRTIHWPHQRMRQRSQRGPLASRRSTAALATQINAMAQLRPCFLRLARDGRYPPHAVAVQRGTSRTGPSAGRNDARAARERGHEPRPREPHSPRQSAVTGDVPRWASLAQVTHTGTHVRSQVTVSETIF